MRLAVIFLLLLAGCGRIRYAPGQDGGGGIDASLADTSTPPDTGEGMVDVFVPPDHFLPPVDSSVADATVVDAGGCIDDMGCGATESCVGGRCVPVLFVILECPLSVAAGNTYTCQPFATREPIAGEFLTWSLGPAHTCDWITISGDTGELGGRAGASDVGGCVIDVVVNSTLGPSAGSSLPITVTAAQVRQVDVGSNHSCALTTTDAVRCWGFNAFGQLGYDDTLDVGDGTTGRSIRDMGDVPVGGRVVQISLAYTQTCALLATGGVRCWGYGGNYRLGQAHTNHIGAGGAGGTIISNGDIALGDEALEVAAGGAGGCARLVGGRVRCWGVNHGYGFGGSVQGDEIIANGDLDVADEPVVALAGGYGHYCALLESGAVRCWGYNGYGELGHDDMQSIGTGVVSIRAAGDVNVGGRVTQISTGDFTTCAVLESGTLRCWGWNPYGQLGYGDTDEVSNGDPGRSITDVGDVPVGALVQSAWAGEEHTCAVTTTNRVRCWGLNLNGQLGYDDTLRVGDGTPGRSIIDMGDVAVGADVEAVVTTDWDTSHTCALTIAGTVRCWGDGFAGKLGYDSEANVGDGVGATIIAAGDVPVL